MIPAVALNRGGQSNAVHWVPHGLGTGIGIVASGFVAIAATWLLLSPTEVEILQAAVSSHDYSTARGHVSPAGGRGTPGSMALSVRARMGDGDTDGALRLLDTPILSDTDRLARQQLRIQVLRAANRPAKLQAELVAIARRTGRISDFRAVLAVATARRDPDGERAMLASLAARNAASVAEVERLAALETTAGDPDAARTTLRILLYEGRAISPGGTAALLALTWQAADPPEIQQTIAALGESAPSLPRVVDSLAAAGRNATALRFAQAVARDQPLALVRQRCELLRASGRIGEARALLDRAIVAPPGTIDSGDIVRISFELGAVDILFTAIEAGHIDRLTPSLGLDLARRAVAAGRPRVLPQLDRIAKGWRDLDPWFAMGLARQAGDTNTALRYARLLGPAAFGAQEAILRDRGDKPGLRRLWLDKASRSDRAGRSALADELLENGYKADSLALLDQAAAQAAPDSPEVRHLAYLWGPRPPETALDWLKARAKRASDVDERMAWLRLYADRDAPASALAMLLAEPDADNTPMRLLELDVAGGAGDRSAQRRIVAALLNGRHLGVPDLTHLQGSLPPELPASQHIEVERRFVAADAATPQMYLDLAWDAINRHQPNDARAPLAAYLAIKPRDASAFLTMAGIEKRAGNRRAERDWLSRALAIVGDTGGEPADVALRAQILEQLGRRSAALATVATLRKQQPDDDQLLVQQARLLITTGHPVAAMKLLKAGPS